jgi:hypothetical protein
VGRHSEVHVFDHEASLLRVTEVAWGPVSTVLVHQNEVRAFYAEGLLARWEGGRVAAKVRLPNGEPTGGKPSSWGEVAPPGPARVCCRSGTAFPDGWRSASSPISKTGLARIWKAIQSLASHRSAY